MKFGFKTIIAAAVMLGSTVAFAQKDITCPTLTTKDIEKVLTQGMFMTDQGYTLAHEAGMSNAEVITNEFTANPFDTYYQMYASKEVAGQKFMVYIGNVLGKISYEAQDRARKIFSDETSYNAKYDATSNICMYKEIHAAPSASYPFKSRYESVVLLAFPYESNCDGGSCNKSFLSQIMMKKRK